MARTTALDIAAGATGRWLLSKVVRTSDQLAFLWVCLKAMMRHRREGGRLRRRVVVQQIYFTGVQSAELITFFAVLAGIASFVQGFFLLSSIGAQGSLASFVVSILLREAGPFLAAVIVILRSGSAITLEIGYMNVLGEIEGLEMQGVSPVDFICVPRLIGVTVSVVCLTVLFDMVTVASGFFAAWTLIDLNLSALLYDMAVALNPSDFMMVLAKGVAFGLVISVTCLYNGFQAQGAITNIPPRVSRAMVDSLLHCVLANIVISAAFSF